MIKILLVISFKPSGVDHRCSDFTIKQTIHPLTLNLHYTCVIPNTMIKILLVISFKPSSVDHRCSDFTIKQTVHPLTLNLLYTCVITAGTIGMCSFSEYKISNIRSIKLGVLLIWNIHKILIF